MMAKTHQQLRHPSQKLTTRDLSMNVCYNKYFNPYAPNCWEYILFPSIPNYFITHITTPIANSLPN